MLCLILCNPNKQVVHHATGRCPDVSAETKQKESRFYLPTSTVYVPNKRHSCSQAKN